MTLRLYSTSRTVPLPPPKKKKSFGHFRIRLRISNDAASHQYDSFIISPHLHSSVFIAVVVSFVIAVVTTWVSIFATADSVVVEFGCVQKLW